MSDVGFRVSSGRSGEAQNSAEIRHPKSEILLRPIPSGHFLMGCEQGRDEEEPVHRVWVDAFEMAVYQVRNREYACFLEATRSPAPPQWNDPHLNHHDQPVVSVIWFVAVAYC